MSRTSSRIRQQILPEQQTYQIRHAKEALDLTRRRRSPRRDRGVRDLPLGQELQQRDRRRRDDRRRRRRRPDGRGRRRAAPRQPRDAAATRTSSSATATRSTSSTSKDLDVHTDIDGMVDEAVPVPGGRHPLPDLAPPQRRRGRLRDQAEDRLLAVERSASSSRASPRTSNQDPQDASVEPSGDTLQPVAAQTGHQGRGRASCARRSSAPCESPDERKVEAKVEKVKPEVTTERARRRKYPTYIVVDRSNFQLRLYKNLELAKTYTVAIGAIGYDTPTGLYHDPGQADRPRLERARLRLGR